MGRTDSSALTLSHRYLRHISRLTAANRLKTIARIVAGTFVLGTIASSIGQMPAQAQALADYPLLNIGSTGETVSQLQATLQLLGFYQGEINGTYSEPTAAAVAEFQTAAGISADGITGPSTWQKLLPTPDDVGAVAAPPVPTAVAATPEPANVNSPEFLGPPVLRAESTGPAVSQLQRELQELGYYDGAIDGGFGEKTLAAVEKFQTDQQLLVDGIVGQATWDALSRALER